MASWTNFGNVVNILTLVDMAKDPIKVVYGHSPSARLAEVKELLDKSDALLKKLRKEDRLLGKIIEKEIPGFTRRFEQSVRRYKDDYHKLWLKLNQSSWLQRTSLLGNLSGAVHDLHKEVLDQYEDKLRTSMAIKEQNGIYQTMEDVYNQDPPVMSEEDFDKALDKLRLHVQFLNQQFGALSFPATETVVTVDAIASYATTLSNTNGAQIPLQQMLGSSHGCDLD